MVPSLCKQSFTNFSMASGLTLGWIRERYTQNSWTGSGTVTMPAFDISLVPQRSGLVTAGLENSSSRRLFDGGCREDEADSRRKGEVGAIRLDNWAICCPCIASSFLISACTISCLSAIALKASPNDETTDLNRAIFISFAHSSHIQNKFGLSWTIFTNGLFSFVAEHLRWIIRSQKAMQVMCSSSLFTGFAQWSQASDDGDCSNRDGDALNFCTVARKVHRGNSEEKQTKTIVHRAQYDRIF